MTMFLLLSFVCLYCKKPAKDDSILCDKIQEMSERCEDQILEIFNRNLSVSKDAKVAEFDYKLISSRVQKQIRGRQAYKQCIRYSRSSDKEDIKRYKNLRSCANGDECSRFAECILRF